MKRDGKETVAINGEESLTANALSNSAIEELLHQALAQGDQDAWARPCAGG